MFTYILDALLVGMAALMLWKGHYGSTRQLAFAPLMVAILDAAFAYPLDPSLTPVLSGILVALQIVILLGCGFQLHRDRVRARNKHSRRQRRREIARTQAAFSQAARRPRSTSPTRPACA